MDAAVEAQIARAHQLADCLQSSGHDVTYLDLLDDLATVGLMLVPIDTAASNVPSEAYFASLSSRA